MLNQIYPRPDWGLIGVFKKFSAVYIQSTNRCLNNCVFCAHIKERQPARDMRFDELEIILKALPDFSGDVSIGMAGEAMLLEDLPERCQLIKKFWPNCRLLLTTTFSIDRGENYLRRLFSALDCMYVSCYAHSEADYKRVHGTQRFSKVKKNVEYIKNIDVAKGKVGFMHMQDASYIFSAPQETKNLQAFHTFCYERGIKNFSEHRMFAWHHEPLSSRACWSRPAPCSIVWGERAGILNIHANLDVVPCCMFTRDDYILGNLHDQTLDDIFSSKKYHEFYKRVWEGRLHEQTTCNSCHIYSDDSTERELMRLAAWQGQQLAGKRVFFWGCGEAYRAYRNFFGQTIPEAILLDACADLPTEIDGIPVRRPEELLLQGERLPIIIFASRQHSATILKKLLTNFPQYSKDDICICPANIDWWDEVSPFC